MHRVAILGPGGGGKTTLAARLGVVTGLTVVHLDQHYWRPGWVPTPRPQWRAWQEQHLPADGRWIVDGNYSGTMDVRLGRADVVVLVLPPRRTRIARCVWRTVRSLGRPVQAPGCPERFNLDFLRWVWRYDQDTLPRVEQAIAVDARSAVVHRLRSDTEVRSFLARASSWPCEHEQ